MSFRKDSRGPNGLNQFSDINILLVEDSRTYQQIIFDQLDKTFGANVTICASYQEVLDAVTSGVQYEVALTDLNVPGAPNGEAMDELLARDIPTVVFTGTFSEEVRDRMLNRRVIDYVVKDNPDSARILAETARKALLNRYSSVLVVDDQKTTQAVMVGLLEPQLYNVHAVFSGKEALHLLEQGHQFDLIVTDYNMPGMNGDEFVSLARKGNYSEDMRILGVSSTGNSLMSAQFLKAGANDFMQRPFAAEEFQWRVSENVETVRLTKRLNGMAYRDFLTELYNRRFLFSDGAELVQESHAAGQVPSVVMIDLDKFKSINDKCGYAAGDYVLKTVADVINSAVDHSSQILTRLGGEEFGVVLLHGGLAAANELAERIREKIAATSITLGKKTIKITASMGTAQFAPNETIDSILNVADVYLHEAKAGGRNQVVSQPENTLKRTA
ncbi:MULTISPECIES: diguanylate cyclase [unclassified Lentilitoribacter]|jgi:diguanylate cyclase (GGDEF)-like protein|uniref:GGDEF domain-containing response regulator n=1 Tax=unclassified Lentilitoribacter TaxID=2647570 RepID=UPI0013A6D8A0|nr:diguanylate cyclase [Lentilitoribacter sp. Alg239-R112]